MHASNKDVIALAKETGRSANSIAMRLQNFEYHASGKQGGLPHGSKMCEVVYNECWQRLGLPAPVDTSAVLPKSDSLFATTSEDVPDLAKINEVVVNIALSVKDMRLIKGDNVDLFGSLTTILRYVDSTSFTLQDLKTLSAAVKSIPDYPDGILRSSLRTALTESQFSKIYTLINIFS